MFKQNEVYFFGKLNQSRDFIFSENLQTHDRFFWDNWFNRCSGQNKLISFTRKTHSPLQIWLFCIKLPDDLIYTGMAAGSSDKIGRKYPFVLFYKPSSIPESLDSLFFLLKKKNSFRKILKEGEYCIEDFYSSDTTESSILSKSFHNFLSDSDGIGSFWQEIESGYHIKHEGLPSCSLFNKLFGL